MSIRSVPVLLTAVFPVPSGPPGTTRLSQNICLALGPFSKSLNVLVSILECPLPFKGCFCPARRREHHSRCICRNELELRNPLGSSGSEGWGLPAQAFLASWKKMPFWAVLAAPGRLQFGWQEQWLAAFPWAGPAGAKSGPEFNAIRCYLVL